MLNKLIISIGVILTGFVFWISMGAPIFTVEDFQKIILVILEQIK